MSENKRRKLHENIESVPTGFANGQAQTNPMTDEEKIDHRNSLGLGLEAIAE